MSTMTLNKVKSFYKPSVSEFKRGYLNDVEEACSDSRSSNHVHSMPNYCQVYNQTVSLEKQVIHNQSFSSFSRAPYFIEYEVGGEDTETVNVTFRPVKQPKSMYEVNQLLNLKEDSDNLIYHLDINRRGERHCECFLKLDSSFNYDDELHSAVIDFTTLSLQAVKDLLKDEFLSYDNSTSDILISENGKNTKLYYNDSGCDVDLNDASLRYFIFS